MIDRDMGKDQCGKYDMQIHNCLLYEIHITHLLIMSIALFDWGHIPDGKCNSSFLRIMWVLLSMKGSSLVTSCYLLKIAMAIEMGTSWEFWLSI